MILHEMKKTLFLQYINSGKQGTIRYEKLFFSNRKTKKCPA